MRGKAWRSRLLSRVRAWMGLVLVVRMGRAIDAPPQARSTSNAITLRVSLLNSTPIKWIGSPDARYLSA